MKKWLKRCLIAVAALLTVSASSTLTSCTDMPEYFTPSIDKAQVQACVDSIVNPEFMTINDVYELQETMLSNAFIDSVFMSMDKETLKNVSSVVLKRLHHVTKDDIVGEFLQHQDIYVSLPPPDASNATSSTPTTAQNLESPGDKESAESTVIPRIRSDGKKAASTSYQYKDTTIDGKHADIVIKTTTYE